MWYYYIQNGYFGIDNINKLTWHNNINKLTNTLTIAIINNCNIFKVLH